MSDLPATPSAIAAAPHAAEHGNHDPHLAHHFDTPEQQFASGKLGMWMFLGTEVLMFGGLFCAYSVYRHNHPEVFELAHRALDKNLGALNTLVLITSSLTMAWGVRAAQFGRTRQLCILLLCTLVGGAGFMCIKGIEYHTKWKYALFVGPNNVFLSSYKGPWTINKVQEEDFHVKPPPAPPQVKIDKLYPGYVDPHAGTPDQAKIRPPFNDPAGLRTSAEAASSSDELDYQHLSSFDRNEVYTFFAIYFLMTGLHGVHVLVGMGLIFWLFLRARKNEFSAEYFAPVDLVGLYWHLVDIIWIFLFPLLYLIH
jgi:cytochrome c oxidase subunit 3